MLKRTLAGLGFLLAITAVDSSPASAFGWWGYGYGGYCAPSASYAPRTYFRPRARFYGPAFYRPGFRVFRRAYYRPFVAGRAFYRPGFRAYGRGFYRPVVAGGFYRTGVRVHGPRARAFYRPG